MIKTLVVTYIIATRNEKRQTQKRKSNTKGKTKHKGKNYCRGNLTFHVVISSNNTNIDEYVE